MALNLVQHFCFRNFLSRPGGRSYLLKYHRHCIQNSFSPSHHLGKFALWENVRKHVQGVGTAGEHCNFWGTGIPASLPAGFCGWCCSWDDVDAPYPGTGARSPGASSLPGPASCARSLGRTFPRRLQSARSRREGGGGHSLPVHANRWGPSANSHWSVN